MTESFDESEFKRRFPYPEKLNREWAEISTEEFARWRLDYSARDESSEFFDPIISAYVKEYPLPVGKLSIMNWFYIRNKDLKTKSNTKIRPLVEHMDTDIGFAYRFSNENAIGWFLGLVKPFDTFHMPKEERKKYSDKDREYLLRTMHYVFEGSMILLEGEPDDSIFDQLKEFNLFYKRKILGMKIGGRPRIDPTAMMYAAGEILKVNPDISQEKLTEKLGIPDISTFKKYRKAADFPTYEDLRKSVKKS